MTKIELETGGSVWKLLVAEGDAVEEGQTLFILEVMKMEVPYEAPHAVRSLHYILPRVTPSLKMISHSLFKPDGCAAEHQMSFRRVSLGDASLTGI